jgi:hypothetical protein
MNAPQRAELFADYDAFYEGFARAGASDGLPMVPPTRERVDACLAAAGLEPGDNLGEVPTREAVLDAERAAANAVMAGCLPEHMPVVAGAIRAWCHPKANAHGTTATLAGAAHAVIVNGPIRRRLGIQCGAGCFGSGWRANAAIGRALRLVIRNMCHARPGFSDRAAYSLTARYSFCFGEDEEGTKWNPLQVERGWDAGADVVTVHSFTDHYVLRDTASARPEALLDRLSSLARSRPIHVDNFVAEDRSVVIVVGPAHRRILESAGWSKADVRAYLHPRLTARHTFATSEERHVQGSAPTGNTGEFDFHLPQAKNIHLVAAGGDGDAQSVVFYPHQATTVSAQITTDGKPGRIQPDPA